MQEFIARNPALWNEDIAKAQALPGDNALEAPTRG